MPKKTKDEILEELRESAGEKFQEEGQRHKEAIDALAQGALDQWYADLLPTSEVVLATTIKSHTELEQGVLTQAVRDSFRSGAGAVTILVMEHLLPGAEPVEIPDPVEPEPEPEPGGEVPPDNPGGGGDIDKKDKDK